MKKMKIAALLCVAALLVLVLAACGGNEPGPEPEPDPTTEPAVQTADPVKDTEDTDYSDIFASAPKFSMSGRCMYCNHCLPCSAQTTKLLGSSLPAALTT